MLFIICYSAYSQTTANSPLYDFNKSRNSRTEKGLDVLGAWAIGNLATSSYLYYHSSGSDKYFNQMNVMWNGANTLIVVASLLPKQKNDMNLTKTLQWQSNTESVYLASAALDLLYSSLGLYLTEKAKSDFSNHDKWKGWGNSLIYNGGFLFLFDTSMFIIHKHNGKKLYNMMEKVNISAGGAGLKITMHL
ncbi:MAG: DUF6992 family protein [Bacteroidia bacterium]